MIRLADVWPIDHPEKYKLHFARWNKSNEPLEVLSRDELEWQSWQEYRPARNDFNRPLIFSLARFHHAPDLWLFGGVFRVVGRPADKYEVELTDEGAGFRGRLKLRSSYRERATRVRFELHYPGLEVHEVLPEPYSGTSFPGFESIDLSFEELETLVRKSRSDWKAALSSIKGSVPHHGYHDWQTLHWIGVRRSRGLVPLVRLRRKWARWKCRTPAASD